MKQRDTVRIVGQTLMTQFAATGETRRLASVNLAPGATLRTQPAPDQKSIELWCDLHGNGIPVMLETFASQSIADVAFDRVQLRMKRQLRWRFAADLFRGLVKYVAIPVGVLLIGLAMNVAVHPDFGRAAPAPVAAASLPSIAVPQAPARPPTPSDQQIAKALSQGAASNKYTVKLGDGSKGTLFVFEDPLCPHCQEFAPELAKLAKDHTVYVFPVSVIGGQNAAMQSAAVLCEPDQKRRVVAWETAQNEGLPVRDLQQGCVQAVSANDDIFQVMALQGTPTVISGNGHVMPYDVPAEAGAISSWLAGVE